MMAPGHPKVPMARAIAWEVDLLGSHGMTIIDPSVP
jgi:alcohol dehydrogenase